MFVDQFAVSQTFTPSVLALWAAVVAERFGFNWKEALSLGKAVAGLTAQSKGRRLGIFKPSPAEVKKARGVYDPIKIARSVVIATSPIDKIYAPLPK